MKALAKILNESLLDADFDVGVEDIYADNIISKVIEIMSSKKFKNYDKTVKELRDLLKNTARKQRAQDANIMKKLREDGNISIYMYSSGPETTILFIQKQNDSHRALQLRIWLYRREDGTGRMRTAMVQPTAPMRLLDRDLKEVLVFLGPGDWDEIVQAYMNS